MSKVSILFDAFTNTLINWAKVAMYITEDRHVHIYTIQKLYISSLVWFNGPLLWHGEVSGHVWSPHNLLWRLVGTRLLSYVINKVLFHHLSALKEITMMCSDPTPPTAFTIASHACNIGFLLLWCGHKLHPVQAIKFLSGRTMKAYNTYHRDETRVLATLHADCS